MDTNTAFVMSLALIAIAVANLGTVLITVRFRHPDAPVPPLININHSGDGSPVAATVGGDAAPVENSYTASSGFEDALAYLARLTDDLSLINEIVAAARENRYAEDAASRLSSLFSSAGENARLALETIASTRERQRAARAAGRVHHRETRANGAASPRRAASAHARASRG